MDRLKAVQDLLSKKNLAYEYSQEDGLGSIEFEYRGISYHIWEYCEGMDGEGGYGAESNVRSGGHMEEFDGDYEQKIIEVINSWK